jgi:multiple sugar transport system ATP-binding protein
MAVSDFSLEVQDKEFVVLVGPSGCGKTTTLRMIAGLEDITSGGLFIDDRLVNDLEPKDRDIAMVFQNYALYPHMSVFDNMGFALKLRKRPKEEIAAAVNEAARILSIGHLLDRKPRQLSGGERQRVAIGRAIVRHPKVFLMDEPLSNLDAKMRTQMRAEIIKLHKRLNTTFVYVTHDQVEAMTLGDRIVVMKDGLIQQIDTPQNIYDTPANVFVAGFIGTPQMNLFHGARLVLAAGDYYVRMFGREFLLPEEKQQILKGKGAAEQAVIAGVRPDDFELTAGGSGITALPDLGEVMGSEVILHVRIPKEGVGIADLSEAEGVVESDDENLNWVGAVIVQKGGASGSTEAVSILPDASKINLFDPATQANLLL